MNERQFLPEAVRSRLALNDDQLIEAHLASTRGRELVHVRARPVEVRSNDDGSRSLTGYATTWGTQYEVAGGPPYGWLESIEAGACDKSLSERDDVRFLINHDGLPLARTKSGTMTLKADSLGLLVEIPAVDMANPAAAELLSALDRGDVDQMSFAFQVVRQEWNADYTERYIKELKLFDVSAVTYPANDATIIGARSEHIASQGGYPLSLALAQAAAL